ncbi:hypothetical protein Tco_0847567 [Tanacetum coccineum]
MSTPVFADLESSTHADGAQSSRVLVSLPEDPYEAIRQAYLVGTNTKSEPFEDPELETPESPNLVASPVSFLDSTPPIYHVEESEGSNTSGTGSTASDSTTPLSLDHPLTSEAAAMSDVAFRKSEGDELEDEDVEDSLDSYSGSEDAKDEGPTAEDEDPAAEDEGLTARVEGPGMDDEGYGLDDESRAPVMGTTVSAPLGLRYGVLRQCKLALEEDEIYSTFEVGQSSGSAPDTERPERVSAFRQPTLTTWTDPEDVATPTATIPVDEDQFIEVGAQLELYGSILQDHTQRLDVMPPTLFAKIDRDVRELYTRSGAVRDEIFSQRYRFRSLEQEHERAVMTFGALWRPVLALDTWAGHVDTQIANMSRAGYDDHRLVHDLLVHQTSLQHELQEMRGRVSTLEQERIIGRSSK